VLKGVAKENLDVPTNCTVLDIKKKIKDRLGVSVDSIRLSYKGKHYDDKQVVNKIEGFDSAVPFHYLRKQIGGSTVK